MMDDYDLTRRSPEYADGRAEAERDIAAGRLMLKDFGPSPSWWNDVTTRLHQEYQVDFEQVETSDGGTISRWIGYNDRVQEELLNRFRYDVLSIAFNEAKRNHESRAG